MSLLFDFKTEVYLAASNNTFSKSVYLITFIFKGSFGSQHTGNQDQTKSIHKIYDRVQELLIFVGYPRSGHTLVSSLLDAHPHVIVANEFDILAQWQKWDATTKNKYYLFDQLLMNSKKEADVGYRSATVQHRYSYHVPGQWQGTYRDSIMVRSLYFSSFKGAPGVPLNECGKGDECV